MRLVSFRVKSVLNERANSEIGGPPGLRSEAGLLYEVPATWTLTQLMQVVCPKAGFERLDKLCFSLSGHSLETMRDTPLAVRFPFCYILFLIE